MNPRVSHEELTMNFPDDVISLETSRKYLVQVKFILYFNTSFVKILLITLDYFNTYTEYSVCNSY